MSATIARLRFRSQITMKSQRELLQDQFAQALHSTTSQEYQEKRPGFWRTFAVFSRNSSNLKAAANELLNIWRSWKA